MYVLSLKIGESNVGSACFGGFFSGSQHSTSISATTRPPQPCGLGRGGGREAQASIRKASVSTYVNFSPFIWRYYIFCSWNQGEITNFEYLMELNKLAGRTFNDLMQYPVFPFILSNYVGDRLDLKSEDSYR